MKIFKTLIVLGIFITLPAFSNPHEETKCFENTSCIVKVKGFHDNTLYIKNLKKTDITISWEITKSENIEISDSPKTVVIPASKTEYLFSIYQKDKTKKWNYYYKYYTTLGNNKVKHNDKYIYDLPFESNKEIKINQGFNSKFSHNGEFKYSIDFDLPEGSNIFSAREGIVVDVKSDSDKGCSTKECANDGNYILIKHDDGTYGGYVHLQKNGSFVKPLDKVKKGQLIGLSGNTGWSSGAHLHFWVYKAKDGKTRESFPIKFNTKQGKGITLLEDNYYSK